MTARHRVHGPAMPRPSDPAMTRAEGTVGSGYAGALGKMFAFLATMALQNMACAADHLPGPAAPDIDCGLADASSLAVESGASEGVGEASPRAATSADATPHPADLADAAECCSVYGCKAWGFCACLSGECIAASDEKCASTEGCWWFGYCSAKGGKCQAVRPMDCQNNRPCLKEGQCTPVEGKCLATRDADCVCPKCKSGNRCKAIDGECTAAPECYRKGG